MSQRRLVQRRAGVEDADELARWAALRAQFKKGAYAKKAEGAVGAVLDDADVQGYRANTVRLRLADGSESDNVKVDTLTEASEEEYEAELAR